MPSDLGAATWSETTRQHGYPSQWLAGRPFSQRREQLCPCRQGGEKRWWVRANPVFTTAGSSTVYTLTYGAAAAADYDGANCSSWHKTCGAAPTLNINGLGARNLRKWTGTAFVNLAAGDIVTNQPIRARYNLAATTFDIVSAASGTLAEVSPGCIVQYAGTTTPAGGLLCYGQAIAGRRTSACSR